MPVDWREKIVEEHPNRIIVLPGENEPRGEADVTVSEEEYRRIYTGFECPWCYQVLATAYERTCKEWCCGGDRVYTIDEWHAFMDGHLDGYKWIGPSREMVERLEARPASSSEIWTPGGS
jgi:hypothetical protein